MRRACRRDRMIYAKRPAVTRPSTTNKKTKAGITSEKDEVNKSNNCKKITSFIVVLYG